MSGAADLLPPDLVERLSRSRLRIGRHRGRVGTGARIATDKGAGLDFADHRPYQAGDDLRHLDVSAYARLREPFVKVHHPQRPLDVTLLVDASASMGFGRPPKVRFAKQVAAGFACAALGNMDRVRICLVRSGRTHLSATEGGSGGLERLLAWLAGFDAAGSGVDSLSDALASLVPALPRGGLTVVIGDLLEDVPSDLFFPLANRDQELVAFQVLDPGEVSPALPHGEARLVDAETGDVLRIGIDDDALARYHEELQRLQDAVSAAVRAVQGRLHVTTTDTPIGDLFMRDLPRLGLLE